MTSPSEPDCQRIVACMTKLPKRAADLLYLHYCMGMPTWEIAKVYGITQAAVSFRLERGLERIRGLLLESFKLRPS